MLSPATTDFGQFIEPVAIELLGEPNRRLSKPGYLRFGNNGSISVDIAKGTWFDYSDNTGGGTLDMIGKWAGRDGYARVEWLIERGHNVEPKRNGADTSHEREPSHGANGHDQRRPIQLAAEYDYRDEAEAVLYQVRRFLVVDEDGQPVIGKDGKKQKEFYQRRPDGNGGWINGVKGVRQVPYKLPEINEALQQHPGRMIFITEGEKAADCLWERGIPATTNAGGAGKWSDDLNEFFEGENVCILPDNDPQSTDKNGKLLFHADGRPRLPGQDHGETVATKLYGTAGSVRVLELPGLPLKGDIVDWFEADNSTSDFNKLWKSAKLWEPEPFRSKFGGKRWEDIGVGGEKYRYIVENLIPAGEAILFYGDTGSGKSFGVMDLGLCIARGKKFNGFNTESGLVIYVAAEAGKGFEKRKVAYVLGNNLSEEEKVPFYLMTKRPDFFTNDNDVDALIAEITEIKKMYPNIPLLLVILDTLSAIALGMNENASQDVGRIKARIDKLRIMVDSAVILVHHKPKGGTTPRGHGSLTADYETTIEYSTTDEREVGTGRKIHTASVAKQREGKAGLSWSFTLELKVVGKNQWGNDDTSCVVRQVDPNLKPITTDTHTTPQQRTFISALLDATDTFGVPPPSVLQLPRSILKVVDYEVVKRLFGQRELNDGDDPKDHQARLRKALSVTRKALTDRGMIGTQHPWIWWTGKSVPGVTSGPAASSPIVNPPPEQRSNLMTDEDYEEF